MRNMSFALTEPQILDGTKVVTRRLGWLHLKVGEQLQPVRKCMGLKRGEGVVRLGPPIIVTALRREPLRAMLADEVYGWEEVLLEGFALHPWVLGSSHRFVQFFCNANKCTADTIVTRIAFAYA